MFERLFGIRAQGSTPRTEILAGIATFLASMYIIVVNPTVLSDAGVPFSSALTATVLVSFFGSVMMGFYAKNPILVAPGMGINALFAYTMVLGAGMEWQTALGCVFWAGVIFALLAAFNARQLVIDAIPAQLRYAIACGIGLFITTIGLVNAQFIVPNPVTVVGMASLDPVLVTFLIGFAVTAWLVVRNVPGALILGIVFTTLASVPIGRLWGDGSRYFPEDMASSTLVNFNGIFAMPDLSGLMALDLWGSLSVAYWPFIFVLLFTTFFDALSTFMGVSEAGNLKDADGNPRNIRRSMIVDASAALISGPLGTSPANAYVESAAGISQGGRTGLVAVVVAVLFLPFLFLSPLLSLVPAIATAPALILVGVFMMDPIRKIHWHQFDDAIPAFVAMVLIPFTYSITHGIAFGFLTFVIVKLAAGKTQEIKPTMWVLFALSLLLLFEG